jgi:hypothetical protein
MLLGCLTDSGYDQVFTFSLIYFSIFFSFCAFYSLSFCSYWLLNCQDHVCPMKLGTLPSLVSLDSQFASRFSISITALTVSNTGLYQEPIKSIPRSYTLLFEANWLQSRLHLGRFRSDFQPQTWRNWSSSICVLHVWPILKFLNRPHCKLKEDSQRTYSVILEGGGVLVQRSRNHFCRWKAVSIIYYECVCCLSYAACKAHASYYFVICGMSGCTVFFHIIS